MMIFLELLITLVFLETNWKTLEEVSLETKMEMAQVIAWNTFKEVLKTLVRESQTSVVMSTMDSTALETIFTIVSAGGETFFAT